MHRDNIALHGSFSPDLVDYRPVSGRYHGLHDTFRTGLGGYRPVSGLFTVLQKGKFVLLNVASRAH